MPDRSQKTEKPTARRLRQAKRDGQVARSPDVGTWLGLLVAAYLLRFTISGTIGLTRKLFTEVGNAMTDPDPGAVVHLLGTGLLGGALAVAPLALGTLVTGVVASVAQGGVRVSGKALRPKWEHLDPVRGIKRVFGPRGAWELAKAMLKTALASVLVYRAVASVLPLTHTGEVVSVAAVVHQSAQAMFGLARDTALAGLVMAGFDYAFQLRRHRASLKMTKQEVKDDYRTSEGDPAIKSAVRSRQMAMRRSRMMAAIATADVVLVNPTHVAVALTYQAGLGAPKVVAKGAGAIAARIRAEAERHRVPMVEDVPLARALYRVCDLGQQIPRELFVAVARILAFVFSLRRRGSAAGGHRTAATPDAELRGLASRRGRRKR
jgi:flagellar biosynthetic protein FlhB